MMDEVFDVIEPQSSDEEHLELNYPDELKISHLR